MKPVPRHCWVIANPAKERTKSLFRNGMEAALFFSCVERLPSFSLVVEKRQPAFVVVVAAVVVVVVTVVLLNGVAVIKDRPNLMFSRRL